MNVKPIIFSAKMVQAILGGRKTQTRRVIKPQPTAEVFFPTNFWHYKDCQWIDGGIGFPTSGIADYAPCKVGDILWVRETWGYARGGLHPEKGIGYNEILYKATDDSDDVERWRSPIYMPKEVARIFLRVTDVRAGRVQDISHADAIAEGFRGAPCGHSSMGMYGCTDCMNTGWIEPPQLEFMETWEALNAKRGYGWDKNPWVWVYTFERVEKPEGWGGYDR